MQTEHKVGGKHFVGNWRGLSAEYVFAHIQKSANPHAPIPSVSPSPSIRLLTICIICIGFLIKNCAISLRFFATAFSSASLFFFFSCCLQFDFYYVHLSSPQLKKNHSSGGLLAAPGGCFLFCFALFSGVESIMLIYFYFHSDCNLCQADELWKRSKRAWKTCREIQFKWDGTRRGVAKNFPSELEATKSVAYQQAPPKCE